MLWCGCKADPDADADATTPEDATDAEAATPKPKRAEGDPLTVDLKLEYLTPLYKGFFSHKPYLQELASTLSPHVDSRSVTIKVVWSHEREWATIQALVPDGEATLATMGDGLADGDVLDPAPLAPYTEALETYRQRVGEAYDLRVLSFGLVLELWDPHSESRCVWALTEGDAAPATPGPRIDCTDPFLKQYEIQRDGDAWPAPIKGSRKARKILLGALGR